MFAIIVNPVSGGGKNAQIAKQIEALLTQRGETYQVFETANEGDGDRQVRRLKVAAKTWSASAGTVRCLRSCTS